MLVNNVVLNIIICAVIGELALKLLLIPFKKFLPQVYLNYSLKIYGKSIKKIEEEVKKVTDYKENITSYYLDLIKDALIVFVIIALIISFIITIMTFDILWIKYSAFGATLYMLFAVASLHDQHFKLINKIRYYNIYIEKTTKRLDKIKNKVNTKTSISHKS